MVMRIQSCEVLWDTELITCEGVQVVWNGSERSNCVVTSSVCVSSVMVSSLVMSLIMEGIRMHVVGGHVVQN